MRWRFTCLLLLSTILAGVIVGDTTYAAERWDTAHTTMTPWLTSEQASLVSSATPQVLSLSVAGSQTVPVDTGVDVSNGDYLSVTAFQLVVYGVENSSDCYGYPSTDANGNRYVSTSGCAPKFDTDVRLPSVPIGSLIAQIGNGAWFLVGERYSQTVTATGRLYLSYNDNLYDDNVGSYAVTVALGSSPSQIMAIPSFKQYYNAQIAPWGNDEYDSGFEEALTCDPNFVAVAQSGAVILKSGATPHSAITNCGSAVTSVAMVLAFYNNNIGPGGNNIDPRVLNTYFRGLTGSAPPTPDAGGAYHTIGYHDGNIVWSAVTDYSSRAHTAQPAQTQVTATVSSYDVTNVTTDLQARIPVILGVTGPHGQHWVVATGISGDTFFINDPDSADPSPGQSPLTLISQHYTPNQMVRVSVSSQGATTQDVSPSLAGLSVPITAPSSGLLTDPNGRQTGLDPRTLTIEQNIPNSYVLFTPSVGDDTGTSGVMPPATSGTTWLILQSPLTGAYQLQVTNPNGTTYSAAIYGANANGYLTVSGLSGALPSTGGQVSTRFTYSSLPSWATISNGISIYLPALFSTASPSLNGAIRRQSSSTRP